ncbi:MAG: ATP-binding protein [Chitinophagales bacterium]
MKKLKNPFLLTGYFGKEYFCNREQELDTLLEHFNNDRNIVLYSWRRMGKTALIKCFVAELEQKNIAETVYVDLLGTRSMNAAIKQITEAVYEKFGKTKSGFSAAFQHLLKSIGANLSFNPQSGMPEFSLSLKQSEKANRSLNALGDFLQKRKKQIIVVLDEFQQIGRYSKENGEAFFRTWMQEYPGIRFIYSGSHRQMMISMFADKNRPFYRSAQLMQLNPISFSSYKPFITQHFERNGKQIDADVIDAIYEWSREQTYCIQLLCNKLFAKHDKIKVEHLQPICTEVINQESPILSNYSNLLTDMQWKVLLAVAKEEPLKNPQSKNFIEQYHLGASSSVSTALKKLIEKELVIQEESSYYIHDVLMTRWLQNF